MIRLLRTAWYFRRRLTTNEQRDLRLAERCAAVCGEVRRIGGITVWTAAPSKLIDEIEPQARVCRRRLETATGDVVPDIDGVRAMIFADRQTLARYMIELRLPLGSGPRFHAGYLFAPLKKLVFAERELFEQVAEPLARLRAVILFRLIEQTDPYFQQGWLTNGLASALARDEGDGEFERLARRSGRRA